MLRCDELCKPTCLEFWPQYFQHQQCQPITDPGFGEPRTWDEHSPETLGAQQATRERHTVLFRVPSKKHCSSWVTGEPAISTLPKRLSELGLLRHSKFAISFQVVREASVICSRDARGGHCPQKTAGRVGD